MQAESRQGSHYPVIGALPAVDGAFVSTGFGPWSVLLAPAAAEGLADLILRGESTCMDLSDFAPELFLVPRPGDLQARPQERQEEGGEGERGIL